MLKTPKTDSSVRKVFISKSVAQCLIALKADQDEIKEVLGNEYQDYNLVMATTFGLPIGDSYLRTKMQEIIDALGLPDVVFHSLRHTSVTYKLKLSSAAISGLPSTFISSSASTPSGTAIVLPLSSDPFICGLRFSLL